MLLLYLSLVLLSIFSLATTTAGTACCTAAELFCLVVVNVRPPKRTRDRLLARARFCVYGSMTTLRATVQKLSFLFHFIFYFPRQYGARLLCLRIAARPLDARLLVRSWLSLCFTSFFCLPFLAVFYYCLHLKHFLLRHVYLLHYVCNFYPPQSSTIIFTGWHQHLLLRSACLPSSSINSNVQSDGDGKHGAWQACDKEVRLMLWQRQYNASTLCQPC